MNANSLSRIYGWPLVLQVLTLIGLVAALVGDGIWDAVSWVALTPLPLVIARFAFGSGAERPSRKAARTG